MIRFHAFSTLDPVELRRYLPALELAEAAMQEHGMHCWTGSSR